MRAVVSVFWSTSHRYPYIVTYMFEPTTLGTKNTLILLRRNKTKYNCNENYDQCLIIQKQTKKQFAIITPAPSIMMVLSPNLNYSNWSDGIPQEVHRLYSIQCFIILFFLPSLFLFLTFCLLLLHY